MPTKTSVAMNMLSKLVATCSCYWAKTLFDCRSSYFPVYTSGAMNPGVPEIELYLILLLALNVLLIP